MAKPRYSVHFRLDDDTRIAITVKGDKGGPRHWPTLTQQARELASSLLPKGKRAAGIEPVGEYFDRE